MQASTENPEPEVQVSIFAILRASSLTARHQGARFISGQVAGGVEPRERGRVVAKHDVFTSWMVAPSRGMYIAVPGGILG